MKNLWNTSKDKPPKGKAVRMRVVCEAVSHWNGKGWYNSPAYEPKEWIEWRDLTDEERLELGSKLGDR